MKKHREHVPEVDPRPDIKGGPTPKTGPEDEPTGDEAEGTDDIEDSDVDNEEGEYTGEHGATLPLPQDKYRG